MGRDRFGWGTAMFAGLLVALLLWGLALGTHIRRHEPGLWTVRFDKLLSCGLDYNGPPFAAERVLWLTCGDSDGWQLWPLK